MIGLRNESVDGGLELDEGAEDAALEAAPTPACIKRSCQRQTTDLLLPVRCMIAAVPRPSAASKTIRQRQTCF